MAWIKGSLLHGKMDNMNTIFTICIRTDRPEQIV